MERRQQRIPGFTLTEAVELYRRLSGLAGDRSGTDRLRARLAGEGHQPAPDRHPLNVATEACFVQAQ